MTLATAILLFGISSLASVDAMLIAQSAPQSDSSAKASVTQAPATKPKASTGKKTGHTKKVVGDATCDPAPANSNTTGSNPATASSQPAGAQSPPATQAPKNCPPEKTIVRQGGIAEQSIQLAGGSAGDQAQKKDAASQMIAATEQNLNKLTGRQLSNAERESVIQIRQFVEQSRAALTAGNLERAQTLAWKAKLLSEDLIGPKK
jgi:hypothetical protein